MINYLSALFQSIWVNYKRIIIFSGLIFITAGALGIIYEQYQPAISFKDPGLAWFDYFFHNLKYGFVMLILGFFTYGIGSFFLFAINGFGLGIAIELMFQNNRPGLIYNTLIPHAIFEIPAILLISVVPFMIWKTITTMINKKIRDRHLMIVLIQELFSSLCIIVVLFLFAAIMEACFSLKQ